MPSNRLETERTCASHGAGRWRGKNPLGSRV